MAPRAGAQTSLLPRPSSCTPVAHRLSRVCIRILVEQREAANAVHKLAHLLQRAIGTSPAFAYWRIVLDKRKRRPRAADCPSVGEALDRCRLLVIIRNFLRSWCVEGGAPPPRSLAKHLDEAWLNTLIG